MRPNAPPISTQMDTFIALSRAYVALTAQAAEVLRPYGLSLSKYNVLRIMRGQGGRLPSGEIGARMVWPSSDLTRLLDGLEQAGLIQRERDTADRRVVHIQLTAEAGRLLKSLDAPMEKLHAQQFRRLSSRELDDLLGILDHLGGFARSAQPGELDGQLSRSRKR